jgi:hypothetical protein
MEERPQSRAIPLKVVADPATQTREAAGSDPFAEVEV